MPRNHPELVADLAGQLGLDLKRRFKLKRAGSLTSSSLLDLPPWADRIVTVEEVLSSYIDITAMPSRSVLAVLSQYAKDSEEKARLATLGSSFSEVKWFEIVSKL